MRTLSSAANAASVPPERNSLLLLFDVLEKGDGSGELPAIDGLSSLAGVLERDTEVRTAGASRLGLRNLLVCVADLGETIRSCKRFFFHMLTTVDLNPRRDNIPF